KGEIAFAWDVAALSVAGDVEERERRVGRARVAEGEIERLERPWTVHLDLRLAIRERDRALGEELGEGEANAGRLRFVGQLVDEPCVRAAAEERERGPREEALGQLEILLDLDLRHAR